MQNKVLLNALDPQSAQRPGSAPPQVDNDLSSDVSNIFSAAQQQQNPVTSMAEASTHASNLLLFGESRPKDDHCLSDPEYVRYYYANKNINPRLPPPVQAQQQRNDLPPWAGAGSKTMEPSTFSEQVLKLHDNADAQAALNLLLGTQLNIKEDPSNTIPIQHPSFRASAGDQGSFVGSWSARTGTASEQLGALLQAYSPKGLSPLLSGDVAGNVNSAGPSAANQQHANRFSVREESSSSALGGLHEGMFAGGSGASTPRAAGPTNQLFDATVGSPCHSRTNSISGSASGLGGGLGTQDPKINLRMSNSSLGDLSNRNQRKHEPSKLRNSSNYPPNFSDPSLDLLGIVPDNTGNVQGMMQPGMMQPGMMQPGMMPPGMMSPGMSPEQQAAAAMAGMTPESMAALLAGNQQAAVPNQLHAMYMAAMYPYYAQQAMQAAAAGPYPGFMPLPPMMGFPGFPMMPPGMGDVRPGFPGMLPGQMPGMPGFPPVPGMMTPDVAAYYQKLMEAQASQMVAAAAASGVKDDGEGAELEGLRHLRGLGPDVMGGHPSSPMRGGRNNRLNEDRRDQSVERLARGGGRGGDRRDSPSHRRDGSRDNGGPGSAPGSARKNSRREEDKRVDAVLDDFKNNKSKRFEFKDIFGHIFEFSLDQHGSRFIQQKLECVNLEELSAAFDEVQPRILALMTDVFGNYVVQKFLDHGALEQRLKLAGHLAGNVLSLSLQMYGCRVVQKALEVLPTEKQCEIVAELDGQVMRCVRDQNGNHVIQKIIECVPTHHILHLLDSFLTCVVPLSSHPFGCRVIQRILEHCQDLKRRTVVMDEILKSTCQLAQDQYGNYVIQHVLEHGAPQERMQVVTQLAPEIVAMSMHKFASNVVEKCLTFCSVVERDVLVQSMLGNHEGGEEEDPLQQMMKDQFGNYVVQKVLEVCDDSQRERLLSHVRVQLHALKKYTYGKHIVARVEKLLAAGTKLQSSSKMNGSRPLPDDSELHALQLMQQLQTMQLAGGAGAGAGAGADGSERSSAPAGSVAAAVAAAGQAPLPARVSLPELGTAGEAAAAADAADGGPADAAAGLEAAPVPAAADGGEAAADAGAAAEPAAPAQQT